MAHLERMLRHPLRSTWNCLIPKEDLMRIEPCTNLNHRRTSPVRFCIDCGKVLNASLPANRCAEMEHKERRLRKCKFCPSCGEQLVE